MFATIYELFSINNFLPFGVFILSGWYIQIALEIFIYSITYRYGMYNRK